MKLLLFGISVLIIVAFFLPYYGAESVVYQLNRITDASGVAFEVDAEIETLSGAFSGLDIALSRPNDYTFFMFVLLLFPFSALVIIYKHRGETINLMCWSLLCSFVLGMIATISALFLYRSYITPIYFYNTESLLNHTPLLITDKLFGTSYFQMDTTAVMRTFPALGYILSIFLYVTGAVSSVYCLKRK